MKARSVVLTTFLFGVATAVVGNAAQNTVPGNYRFDAVMAEGEPLLPGQAQVYVLDRGGDVVARRHAMPAVFDLGRGDFTAANVYKYAQGRGTIEPGTKSGNKSDRRSRQNQSVRSPPADAQVQLVNRLGFGEKPAAP